MSDALAKARAIADAAKAQRVAMDHAERDYPSSIGMFVGEHTGFVVMPDKMLSAMLNVIRVADVFARRADRTEPLWAMMPRLLADLDAALDRVYALIGDDDE